MQEVTDAKIWGGKLVTELAKARVGDVRDAARRKPNEADGAEDAALFLQLVLVECHALFDGCLEHPA